MRGCELNFQLEYQITNLPGFFWHNKPQKERVSTESIDYLIWTCEKVSTESIDYLIWTPLERKSCKLRTSNTFLTIFGEFYKMNFRKNFAIVSFYARAVYVQKPHWFCNTSIYSYAAQWSNIRKNVQNMYADCGQRSRHINDAF